MKIAFKYLERLWNGNSICYPEGAHIPEINAKTGLGDSNTHLSLNVNESQKSALRRLSHETPDMVDKVLQRYSRINHLHRVHAGHHGEDEDSDEEHELETDSRFI
jgi:hypothetical protein